jgi:hypothetical protein
MLANQRVERLRIAVIAILIEQIGIFMLVGGQGLANLTDQAS